MRTRHVPFFGIVLVMIIIAAAIAPGALSGKGGAAVEASMAGENTVVAADQPAAGDVATELVANCRYGVATNNSDQRQWLDDLGAGWWLDFQVNYTEPAPNGAEYAHVIWVQQQKNANGDYLNGYDVYPSMSNNSLGFLVERRPGRIWIVGNEVERGPNPSDGAPGQGDTMPQMYARIYHDVYHYIKSWDPTALVTPSALVEFTPGRAQYLSIVYDTYKSVYGKQMPVDLWNMHLYILPELKADGSPNDIATVALGTDPALGIYESGGDKTKCSRSDVYCMAEHDDPSVFAEQVVLMRQWMKDHGYQYYPLIITEYSLLYKYETLPDGSCQWKDEYGNCFTRERARDYAVNTYNYMEAATSSDLGYPYDNNRLVQQWMWYSMYQTTDFATSNLASSGSGSLNLTLAGQATSAATRAEPAKVNLVATAVDSQMGAAIDGDASVLLTVVMRNNGNTRVNAPINVTFYSDKNLTKVIGTTTVQAPNDDFIGMTGCGVRGLKVNVHGIWPDTPPGDYMYWVKVDSSNSISEVREDDNVASGVLTILPAGTFLPLLVR